MLQPAPYAGMPQSVAFVDRNGILTPNVGFYIIKQLLTRTGLGSGVPLQVTNNISAVGTTQGTAVALTTDINEVLTTPAGTGAILFAMQVGQQQYIFNGGLNTLSVYPIVGSTIDALAKNQAYQLGSGKSQIFTQFGTTQVRSLQLG